MQPSKQVIVRPHLTKHCKGQQVGHREYFPLDHDVGDLAAYSTNFLDQLLLLLHVSLHNEANEIFEQWIVHYLLNEQSLRTGQITFLEC